MNVVIDRERYVGGGQCVPAAPDVFDQRDADGIVVLLQEPPPESQPANGVETAALCPAAAIRIREQ